jgi:hypothetical protein
MSLNYSQIRNIYLAKFVVLLIRSFYRASSVIGFSTTDFVNYTGLTNILAALNKSYENTDK